MSASRWTLKRSEHAPAAMQTAGVAAGKALPITRRISNKLLKHRRSIRLPMRRAFFENNYRQSALDESKKPQIESSRFKHS
ncbi:hypothetical protein [Paraburkholderia bryophila]|uniref:Uncharacterized protein n=1 Tax=Paraburkholderia bryophila TaxID=420952 RepID=A0A7Y9WR05_9BURK|nr:hypothetical protein [Paraburkholderia bryophila]NYH24958.1 hypothetical protein [Paraburkholderia bryophila]